MKEIMMHITVMRGRLKVKLNGTMTHFTSTLILYYTVDLIIIKKNYHTYH